ncbi:MAG: class I SAM-dependent methyltransferase [Roseiarcus sp.]
MTAAQARMWDQRYAGEDYAYGLAPNAFLAAQSRLWAPGMRALVPGDGEGRNGVFLAEQGLVVETLDLSEHGVAKTLRLAAAKNVSVEARQADALTWDWPQNAYDLIALVFLHLVEPERRRVHARALAALKPGGHIVLEAFRPEQIERHGQGTRGGPRDAQLLYTLDDLSDDFAAAEIVELAAADVDLSEGLLHRGPSATVRLVARKR